MAPADYTAIPTTTLTFGPGVTARPITVTVKGDLLSEPDETFKLNLGDTVNATLSDSQGLGTIRDDDTWADLTLSKTANLHVAGLGQPLTYTLLITNAGPLTATGVVVSDTLPVGVTFGSVTSSQGSCEEDGGTVTCHLGSLPLNTVPLVQSTFDTNAEGWTTTPDALGNPTPGYAGLSGNPGGYIYGLDAYQGLTFFYKAPAKFLGNQAAAYQGSLAFDLRRADILPDPPGTDVKLIGASLTLTTSFATPNTSWTTYNLPLAETSWINTATGQPPSQLEMLTVLSSLDGLQIRGEYSAYIGDGSAMDNVVLSRGPARITLVVTPTMLGSVVNTARVTANEPDPLPLNNSGTESTFVTGAGLPLYNAPLEADPPLTGPIYLPVLLRSSPF